MMSLLPKRSIFNKRGKLMKTSKHATKRMSQRAITTDMVEFILEEGLEFDIPGQSDCYLITGKKRKKGIEFHKRQIRKLENSANKAVKVSDDGTIMTVEYRFKRFKRLS